VPVNYRRSTEIHKYFENDTGDFKTVLRHIDWKIVLFKAVLGRSEQCRTGGLFGLYEAMMSDL
jgi:hypothetical protein